MKSKGTIVRESTSLIFICLPNTIPGLQKAVYSTILKAHQIRCFTGFTKISTDTMLIYKYTPAQTHTHTHTQGQLLEFQSGIDILLSLSFCVLKETM